MRRKLRVLFAAFEAVPFMKTGGLGDVGGSLPQALKEAGCECRVIMPKFMTIPEEYKARMTHVTDFYVSLGWRSVYCGIEKLTHRGVVYYFVDNEYYFNRERAYGYFDDGERVAYFSKAIVECLQYLPDFKCDVLHCNDWHTALAPVFLREFYQGLPLYENVKTVFSVHNLKFQGQMSDYVLGDVLGLWGIPAAASQLRSDERSINYMKGGLLYSDILSTVSKTYAEEIKTPFFGEHMDGIFRDRASVLYGIMNGIDTQVWDPETDKLIPFRYTAADRAGKAKCKAELQKELGLEVNADVPLVVMIGRLTEQKGMDLVQRVIGEILDKAQLAVLGTGDKQYEDMLSYYSWERGGRCAACIRFDEALSHRMYAGADMLLMPSLFEPCGLSQMIAMRYGTLPVVRETGGLKDSVTPYNRFTGEGTGFSFANYNAHEMLFTVQTACRLFEDDKESWNDLMDNAMAADFSWNRAAREYLDVYQLTHPEIEPWSGKKGGADETEEDAKE